MDTQTATRLLALGRVGIGIALLAAPEKVVTPWIGETGTTTVGRLLGNVIGVRDLVVGVGQLAGLSRGGARPWIVAGAVCDLVDGLATLRAREDLPSVGVAATAAIALGGAAAGAWLQSSVD